MSPEQKIVGEIDDDAVRLAQQSGPQSVRLELTNVGQDPCALVVVTTPSPPDDLPIADGRVALDFGSDPNGAYPMQAGVEINGERVGRGEPADDELEEFEAAHAVVQPGDIARVQLALIGTPERDERVIICNDPGDYQAGRYAVLLFER